MKELIGTEKQIQYANDIIREVNRILPLANKYIEDLDRKYIERKGKGSKINALNLNKLQKVKQYIEDEDRADIIITTFKNVLIENETNKITTLINCSSLI